METFSNINLQIKIMCTALHVNNGLTVLYSTLLYYILP